MNKILTGLLFGAIAGVIDVIPMILQGIGWDANLSAFAFWIVVGFLISTSNLKLHPMLKGLTIAYLTLIPLAFLIAWQNAFDLIPIGIMTLILGSVLGWSIDRMQGQRG
ncbi:hypothetical protein ACFL57_02010 [Candidatus Margulisiibacteriota bacterium]